MNYIKIYKFYIFSIIFTLILGTILHFAFQWSNSNLFVASFSAVNESTWEHLKLVYYPMIITIIIGYFYLENDGKRYLCSKTIGIISAMIFIIIFFYTYTGIIGTNYSFFNIAIFVLAVIFGEYVTYLIMKSKYICNLKISILILLAFLFCFILFTYFPPKLNLFKDPITNSYGISKASN